MSNILVGVDAGAYTFDATAKTVTITGIPGLVLQSIKMVVDQTAGKVLYSFDGKLPATLVGGVLTLNAGTDLTGCANGDTLAVYVSSNYDFGDPQGGEILAQNHCIYDFDQYSTQTGTLTPFAGTGPFAGTVAHLWDAPTQSGNGINWDISLNGRTDGLPITYSFYVKGTGALVVKMYLTVDGGDEELESRDYKITDEWRRVYITMIPINRRADQLRFQITSNADNMRCLVACPALHFGLLRPGRYANSYNRVEGYSNSGSPKAQNIPKMEGQPPSIDLWGDSMPGAAKNPHEIRRAFNGANLWYHSHGGETSTQIKDRFLARTNRNLYGLNIFWSGRNNTDFTLVLPDTAAMIRDVGHGQFLVVSVLHAVGEFGTGFWTPIETANAAMKLAWGTRFVDLNAVMCDATGLRAEYTPEGDIVHVNAVGSTVIADELWKAYKLNGWA